MSSIEEGVAYAESVLKKFRNRYGEVTLLFCCHAAVPIVLTPHFLYSMRENFKFDIIRNTFPVPWESISDILLSDFSELVGYETYKLDETVRKYLLKKLVEDFQFGKERLDEVAHFIISYVVGYSNNLDVADPAYFIQSQKFVAFSYLDPYYSIQHIADFFSSIPVRNSSELIRLYELFECQKDYISVFDTTEEVHKLSDYMLGICKFSYGDFKGATDCLLDLYRNSGNGKINISGVELLLPEFEINEFSFTNYDHLLEIAKWEPVSNSQDTFQVFRADLYGEIINVLSDGEKFQVKVGLNSDQSYRRFSSLFTYGRSNHTAICYPFGEKYHFSEKTEVRIIGRKGGVLLITPLDKTVLRSEISNENRPSSLEEVGENTGNKNSISNILKLFTSIQRRNPDQGGSSWRIPKFVSLSGSGYVEVAIETSHRGRVFYKNVSWFALPFQTSEFSNEQNTDLLIEVGTVVEVVGRIANVLYVIPISSTSTTQRN